MWWWADCKPRGGRLIDGVEKLTENILCRAGSQAIGQQERFCSNVRADQQQIRTGRERQSRRTKCLLCLRLPDIIVDQ